MFRRERRGQERYPLEHQPDGKLFVKTATSRYAVKAVRDISSNGVSVSLDHDLTDATDVTVEYLSASGKLEVFGRIAWCVRENSETESGQDKDTYLLGIDLLGPLLLAAALQRLTSPA